MMERDVNVIETAEVELPCADLEVLHRTVAFFTERFAFRVERVVPADDPRVVVVSGGGLRLRVTRERRVGAESIKVRIAADVDASSEQVAPNGTRVDVVAANPPLHRPPLRPSLSIARAADATWVEGRAGMLYRDLLPDRQGGRFGVSHIRIPNGGAVPDYVHSHRVRFQMIFCRRGWVRVVYEDQGAPFVLNEGDCVLQPPGIRHRVLECSDGLEVVEVGDPADHETNGHHDAPLPTTAERPERLERPGRPDRLFEGQRFVRYQRGSAEERPWTYPGFVAAEVGIDAATNGVAAVRVVRRTDAPAAVARRTHDQALRLLVVLAGAVRLDIDGAGTHDLAGDDSIVVPAGVAHSVEALPGGSLRLLEVSIPTDRT